MGSSVRLEVEGGVGVVRIDRPPANAISHAVGVELGEAFAEAAAREDIGAVVVWGGPSIFAAGADIKEMVGFGPAEILPTVSALAGALDILESMSKISIAAVNGFALGGGMELALAADLRYLGTDAKLGQPEIKLGVIPGAGGTQRLPRIVGAAAARRLVFTGQPVDAKDAERLGLADRVLEPGAVFEMAIADARGFARGPRAALAAAKAALRAAAETPGPEGFTTERELFVALFDTADQKEGMRAFLEKRPPDFAGGRT
jgi:enoyl-CoA hydratase/carnithine racemase